MGGDIIAGTNIVDGLKVFEQDPETEGMVIVGEVGGRAEEDAAEWIKDYLKRTSKPKPIAALVAGKYAPPSRIMGHAGAWAARGEHTAAEKYKILQDAGANMVDHPENFGETMKTLLSKSGRDVSKITGNPADQKRGYHTTMRRGPVVRPVRPSEVPSQRRNLHLRAVQVPQVMESYLENINGVALTSDGAPSDAFYVGITVDRTERQPCIRTSPSTDVNTFRETAKRFPFDQREEPSDSLVQAAIEHIKAPNGTQQLTALVKSLAKMYKDKEAVTISGSCSLDASGNVRLHAPSMVLQFDDSAYRSSKRHEDIHALRQKEREQPDEVEAEKDGIVFVHLEDPDANIGTLVNGAGLAMNTVDALRLHGGKATNFLDTGGKATSETVKKSFELILKDPRVKVIFVNIFGGLTDGGMIANGVLLAFKEVDMKDVPVVVRIRGTNEEAGQKIIAESGLGLEAFDQFAEAADRVVEIANSRK
jgi:succinyl-CoA synthetase alpha subunit